MVITLVMLLVGKVITLETKNWKSTACGTANIVKMTGNDQLCAYRSSNSRRSKLELTDSDTQIQGQ